MTVERLNEKGTRVTERLFTLTLLVLRRFESIVLILIGHSGHWNNICPVAMRTEVAAKSLH